MKTLHLTLKKKWFDMIASGEKKEEYREVKSFWIKRLLKDMSFDIDRYPLKINEHKNVLNRCSYSPVKFDTITFRNGYSKDAPIIVVKFEGIEIGSAKPEWSDNWPGEVFIIKLGEINHDNQIFNR